VVRPLSPLKAKPRNSNGMQTLVYDTSDAPTIREFLNSDAFLRAIMGPLGSGKSTACIWDIVNRGLRQRPGPDGIRRTRWCVVRNTFSQLNDTTIKTVHQWFPPITTGRYRATDHEFVIDKLVAPGDKYPAQIELLFRALDRPDHVRKLLSLDLTGAWRAVSTAIRARSTGVPPGLA
jgi:hypothetical protein